MVTRVFNNVFSTWTYFGIEILPSKIDNKYYGTYINILKHIILYYFPISLTIILLSDFHFNLESLEGFIFNTIVLISIFKYIIIIKNQSKISRILEICRIFERNLKIETHIKNNFLIISKRLFNVFQVILCLFICSAGITAWFFSKETPLFKEYFPFNYKHNFFNIKICSNLPDFCDFYFFSLVADI